MMLCLAIFSTVVTDLDLNAILNAAQGKPITLFAPTDLTSSAITADGICVAGLCYAVAL